MSPTREICKRCGKESAVGFAVPDAVWEAVSRGRWNVLCLACFTEEGDAQLVDWDQDMLFFPVSAAAFGRELS